jgi:hypothetical protein
MSDKYQFLDFKLCLNYRMNAPNAAGKASVLNQLGKMFSNVTNAAKNAVVGKNSTNATRKNNSKPITQGVMNAPVVNNSMKPNSTMPQMGGMAPVNFRYPANMQQPSEKVMEWATTAGAPMPPESEMRNVAHGGKRRTHRKRKMSHRRKTRNSCMGGRRRKHTMKRKSHKRKSHRRHRHHKRRN